MTPAGHETRARDTVGAENAIISEPATEEEGRRKGVVSGKKKKKRSESVKGGVGCAR